MKFNFSTWTFVFTLAFLVSSTSFSKETTKAKGKSTPSTPTPSKKETGAKNVVSGKLIWEAWYTVTIDPKTHYGFYQDRITEKDGKITFQNNYYKNEEGSINEEHIVAVAENNSDLSPLFFNFSGVAKGVESIVDGNFLDGRQLTAHIRKGGESLPTFKKQVPPKTILSVFFPLWIRNHLKSFKSTPIPFDSLLEDSADASFEIAHGLIRLDPPDAVAKKLGAQVLYLDFVGQKSRWYVNDQGTPLRIDMIDQKTLVEKVSESEAKRFLNSSAPKTE